MREMRYNSRLEFMTPPHTQLLATALLAARRAGDHVMANLHRRDDALRVERRDVKHALDVEAQDAATAVLREAWPGHAILGEETADAPLPDAPVRWVVDPIDGTVNFFHGLPQWCVCVAAQIECKTVAGVVYAPELGYTFEATTHTPALCNGRVLRVSKTSDTQLATIHTGSDKGDASGRAFRFMRRVAEIAQRPRIMGSAALDICFVASGKADAYFESGIFLWDIAAAGLILERAGGKIEVLKDHGAWRMAALATNGIIHAACRDALLPLFDPESP